MRIRQVVFGLRRILSSYTYNFTLFHLLDYLPHQSRRLVVFQVINSRLLVVFLHQIAEHSVTLYHYFNT